MMRTTAGSLLTLLVLISWTHASSLDLWTILNVWEPRVQVQWTDTNVSKSCGLEMQQYASDLNEYKLWALKMLDASGRPASKLLYGNELWLGSHVQCEEVARETARANTTDLRAVFRVVHFSINLSQPFNMELSHVSLGVCLPAACGSETDVRQIMNLMVAAKPKVVHNFSVLQVKIFPAKYSILSDPVFIGMAVLCCMLLIMMIAATALDVFLSQDTTNLELLPQNNMRLLTEALLAFSVRRNVRRFFSNRSSSQEGALVAVHGLRVTSFSWVMTCHTCLCILHFADNKGFRATAERDFLFQMLTSGTFSVDTFFFLSGLLISYVFLRIEKDAKSSKNKAGPSEVMKFVWICVYRIVRLTPPYVFVLGLVVVSMRYYVDNSVFEAPNLDLHDNCAIYWWRNLLYINTFYPGEQMCMGWSWYLSIDTQLYVVATALLIVSLRRPWLACALGAALLLSSWAISAAISVQHSLNLRIDEPFALYDFLYDKPWTRIGPYIVGMGTGWLLTATNCTIKMNKVGVVAGWSVSLATMFMLVHALHGGGLGTVGSAIYVALSHSLWAVTVAWTLVACTTGHGGWITRFLGSRLMVPFSRATYCAYLIHSAVIQWVFFNMDAPITMSRDLIAMLYVGFSMASYCLGVFISLMFEAPFTSLLSLARRTSSPKQLASTDSKF